MIEIYTDGAYSSLRDQGGYAFVVVQEPPIIKYHGLIHTTNNRMEILGVLQALQYLKDNNISEDVTMYCDSLYVINSITKDWKLKKNVDLWEQLFPLLPNNIIFQHVKGHSSNKYNNLCDKWAVFASHINGCETDTGYANQS